MKWARQRFHLGPANIAAMAFFSPRRAELDSSTSLRPRMVNDLRKANQGRMAQKTLHHFSLGEGAEPGGPPSPGLEFTPAGLRAGPEGWVRLAGGLRFGRGGYPGHRTVLLTRQLWYCTASRQLRALPLPDDRSGRTQWAAPRCRRPAPGVSCDPRFPGDGCPARSDLRNDPIMRTDEGINKTDGGGHGQQRNNGCADQRK